MRASRRDSCSSNRHINLTVKICRSQRCMLMWSSRFRCWCLRREKLAAADHLTVLCERAHLLYSACLVNAAYSVHFMVTVHSRNTTNKLAHTHTHERTHLLLRNDRSIDKHLIIIKFDDYNFLNSPIKQNMHALQLLKWNFLLFLYITLNWIFLMVFVWFSLVWPISNNGLPPWPQGGHIIW